MNCELAHPRCMVSVWSVFRTTSFLTLAGLIIGCNGASRPNFPTATLQGIVTIDRTSVKEGSLQFVPQTGVKGQVSQAKIVNGAYVAKNVPVGKVRVVFNITRETGRMITEYSSSHPEIENLVPQKYREGIELTVTGDDHVPFDLVSDAEEQKPADQP